MKMRLDKELDQLGCDISADCFREILAGLFNGYYASWTDDLCACTFFPERMETGFCSSVKGSLPGW